MDGWHSIHQYQGLEALCSYYTIHDQKCNLTSMEIIKLREIRLFALTNEQNVICNEFSISLPQWNIWQECNIPSEIGGQYNSVLYLLHNDSQIISVTLKEWDEASMTTAAWNKHFSYRGFSAELCKTVVLRRLRQVHSEHPDDEVLNSHRARNLCDLLWGLAIKQLLSLFFFWTKYV